MGKAKLQNAKVPVFALITPAQRDALDRLKTEKERSLGFLIREAIAQFLANPKNAPHKKR